MKKQAPILLLRPRRSPVLAGLVLAMHGLGVVAVWLSALSWVAALGVSLALAAGGMMAWRGLLPVRELQWGAGGTWQIALADGRRQRGLLDAQASRSLPWWVTLAFRLEDGTRLTVMLPRDSLPADDYRRLRSRLRVEAGGMAKRGRMDL